MENSMQPFKRLQWILIVVFFGILLFTFSQEKTVNNGAGYDGIYYRDLVRNFPEMLHASFSDYKASRVLPFAAAHYLLNVLNIEPTDGVILFTIWGMMFLLMIAGVVYYFKIAELLQWRPDLTLLGFVLLFYQFAVLKYSGYYPILTDHFIFSLTIIVLYHFLKKQYLYMMLTGFAACFIWPTYSLFIPLLLLNNPVNLPAANTQETKYGQWLWKLVKLGLALVPVVLFVYLIRSQNLWIEKRYLTADRIYANFRPYNFLVSVIATAAVYGYYLALLWPVQWQMITGWFKSLFQTKMKQLMLAIVFVAAVAAVKYFMTLGNTEPPYPTIGSLLVEFTFRPAVAPFNFIVFAFWFLGLLVFFSIRFYKQLLQQFLQLGNGYFILLVYSLIFLTTAQPRFLTTMLPFFLVALMPVLQQFIRKQVPGNILLLAAAFSLLVSRFWFPVEVNPHYMVDGDTAAEKLPMFIGPWISDYFYCWLTVTGLLLYFIWHRWLLRPMLQQPQE